MITVINCQSTTQRARKIYVGHHEHFHQVTDGLKEGSERTEVGDREMGRKKQ